MKHYLLLLIGGVLFLAGCGGEAVVTEPEPTSPPALFVATPTATAVPQLAPPVIVAAALSPTPTATAEPTAAPQPTATAAPPGADEAFIPPPLPEPSPHEHFWLARPVPRNSVVWTDKVYPYGGTYGGTLRVHHGVEFFVPSGSSIYASAAGTVIVAGDDNETVYGPQPGFYGNLVVIQHDFAHNGRPVFTLYAHLYQVLVAEGQTVAVGERIALSGDSGVASGPHLHFEVRVGENGYSHTRNPLLWLYPFVDRGVVAGRVSWADGGLIYGAALELRRLDAPSDYAATTTYGDDEVNGDDYWGENFALDDVMAGYYELTLMVDGRYYRERFWVFPYQTTFVEFVLER